MASSSTCTDVGSRLWRNVQHFVQTKPNQWACGQHERFTRKSTRCVTITTTLKINATHRTSVVYVHSELSRTHVRMQIHVRLTFEDPSLSRSIRSHGQMNRQMPDYSDPMHDTLQYFPYSCPSPHARHPGVPSTKAKIRSSLDHEKLHNVVPKLHVSIYLTDP